MQSALSIACALLRSGKVAEAEDAYRSLILQDASNGKAVAGLGAVLHQKHEYARAINVLSEALTLDSAPHYAVHVNLGSALACSKRLKEAEHHLRLALRLDPALATAHCILATVLVQLDRADEAASALCRAVELDQRQIEPAWTTTKEMVRKGMYVQAELVNLAVIRLRPNFSRSVALLARCRELAGDVKGVIAAYRKALNPGLWQSYSNFLFVLHYDADSSPRTVFAEHLKWARKHARPLYPRRQVGSWQFAVGSKAPSLASAADCQLQTANSPLRIGYVSCHLRSHPVPRFFAPILQHHDKEKFNIFIYDATDKPDDVNHSLRSHGHTWRECTRFTDDQLATQIRQDNIDILIDLMGHIGGHRLLLFARKPAPIQITYLGYPDTTGLQTIDYRITDSVHDPPGQNDHLHTETLLRLDPCCWYYRPDDNSPDVNDLPALKTGHITFAALNKLIKASPLIINLWSRIMQQLPNSTLKLLVNARGDGDDLIYQRFESHGIPRHRIDLIGRCSRQQYLRHYHDCDIALDTFPYNGHTTTLDSLWMGVPVVSLCGQTHVQRAGLSCLSAIGLPHLATPDPNTYVNSAISLATNLHELSHLRSTLRQKMAASPIRDEKTFTHRLESTLLQVYCFPLRSTG